MNSVLVSAIARHILTGIAGGLTVKYGVDGATVDAIVGGLAALAGVGWSIWDKKQNTNG